MVAHAAERTGALTRIVTSVVILVSGT